MATVKSTLVLVALATLAGACGKLHGLGGQPTPLVSFDAGLPTPLLRRDAAGELTPLAGEVVKLNDQHAFVAIAATTPLAVGDLVCLGVSHPCTALDHWRLAPLLDDDRRVVDCVRRYF